MRSVSGHQTRGGRWGEEGCTITIHVSWLTKVWIQIGLGELRVVIVCFVISPKPSTVVYSKLLGKSSGTGTPVIT